MKKIIVALFLVTFGYAQHSGSNYSWEEITQSYHIPNWFADAKFGIWVHWGAQTEPKQGGGWYARHMYMPDVGKEKWGRNAYVYHSKTYGHPSQIGYKDVINQWKAEKLNANELVKFFKKSGAKYFVALANHHDHFDNFDSTYHEWNSVNVGPKKDIIKEFELASKKNHIPFGVSSHDDRFLTWWLSAFGSDSVGAFKGISYDGRMTKEDGKGKWWEGLDPAKLYGLPPEKRTPEYIKGVKENWLLRHRELATKYDVDLLWFDGYGFPYGEYGKEVCRDFLNYKKEGVVVGKISGEPAVIKDIERGGSDEILKEPWQGITTFRTWFYKEDPGDEYKHNARTVIELLLDYNSKNGNLLLNVELLPDGTIPPQQKEYLEEIGNWIKINKEAIFGSRPWLVYGDNIGGISSLDEVNVGETDLKQIKNQKKEQHFNERTLKSEPYASNEVRFLTNKGNLYVAVLNPVEGEIKIPVLGMNSKYHPKKIKKIKLLGSCKRIKFNQTENNLTIEVPKNNLPPYAIIFKLKGAK